MKDQFVEKALSTEKLQVISAANEIIEGYQAQGFRLTLRQLYYQFVSKNLITNEERSYKRLASTISDGRLVGLIDWNAIEDRGRVADVPYHHDSLESLVESFREAGNSYTIDKWRGQDTYVELWVEKQALAGVLEPMARKHHVTLMVNKGYSSQSAMYESAQRFHEGTNEGEREALLLYLGDHDPSGEDMVRDIRERLEMFRVENLTVQKVALTTAQVRQYKPPPNPAKLTDPRAADYIAIHGPRSWEVDALLPQVLQGLITTAIEAVRDVDVLAEVMTEQRADRARLAKALKAIKL